MSKLRLVANVGLALALTLAGARRAGAHASPHVLDILFRPEGDVLLTNRGLIFGDAERSDWRLMCNEALGIGTSERPSLVGLEDGGLLVASSRGLSSSIDQGCSWRGVEPFAAVAVPALVADPREPARLYLSAYTPDASGLGGVHASDDGGASWQQLTAAGERDYVRSIAVAPSDSGRVYATGQSWDAGGTYSYYLASSRDRGLTWERNVVALEPDERELRLLAVSPRDPELLALRAGSNSPASNPERLLISRDGGSTFTSPLETTLLSALAFSSAGDKAWAASQDGVFESSDGLASFIRVGDAISMSYVVESDGGLLACGFYTGVGTGDNGIGRRRASGEGFESFMELAHVSAPIACDAASPTATTCAPWWLDWQRELMMGAFAPDGGLAVAGSPSAAGSGGPGPPANSQRVQRVPRVPRVPPMAAKEGGCSAPPPAPPASDPKAGFGLLVLVAAFTRRAARARARRRG